MTGHTQRRSRFPKRTHRNQDLGPFINHEMNRCIQCYRCVRYYRGIAGGRDLNVFASHDHVYFGRSGDGPLESEFSGNLVEICPTGVFTDRTQKQHYVRTWDLQTAPSLCVHCAIGCNTTPGERSGTLRRILNRYNHEVNGYFLCDRGRFGYGFVNSAKRVRTALLRTLPAPGRSPFPRGEIAVPPPKKPPEASAVDRQTVLSRIAEVLSAANGVIGIGSPRASLESNFALRSLVGEDRFFSGLADREQELTSLIVSVLGRGPAPSASLREIGSADAVLILGEDISNTAPMMALAVRQAGRNRQFAIAAAMKLPLWDDSAVRNAGRNAASPIFILSPAPTRLDDAAAQTHVASPDEIARLGSLIAHEIDSEAPAAAAERRDAGPLAGEIASVLLHASRPVIICGTGCASAPVIRAAANIAWALRAKGNAALLAFAVPECNTLGAALLAGRPLSDAFQEMNEGRADTVIILENDLFRRSGEQDIRTFLTKAKNVIVLDHITHRTAETAHIVLPAATFAESPGTLVNYESRAQRFYQVFVPEGDIQAGWRWIDDIMKTTGGGLPGGRLSWDDLLGRIASTMPLFGPVRENAPPAGLRMAGMKVPRQSHRASGRTALTTHRSMHEPRPDDDPDSPLAFSMEGYEGQPPQELRSRVWAPGWNSVQALNRFPQEGGGPLRGGGSGRLLTGTPSGAAPAYFTDLLPGDPEREGAGAPSYDIYRSEELSACSPPVAERARASRPGGRTAPDGKDQDT